MKNNSLDPSDTFEAGVSAISGGTVEIRDSKVEENKKDGLRADNGTLIAEHVEVTGNDRNGVFTTNGTATITHSFVSINDANGIVVGENSALIAKDVDILTMILMAYMSCQ